jgi:threonyl-tRNA synthetase
VGSLERFMGILIEHCAGSFPFWLAPEQIRLLSITERSAEFARKVESQLRSAGLRARADVRNETIGAKIRGAQIDRVPAMLVVGDREAESGMVALRLRRHGNVGTVSIDAFVESALKWDQDRTLELDWTPPDEPAAPRS